MNLLFTWIETCFCIAKLSLINRVICILVLLVEPIYLGRVLFEDNAHNFKKKQINARPIVWKLVFYYIHRDIENYLRYFSRGTVIIPITNSSALPFMRRNLKTPSSTNIQFHRVEEIDFNWRRTNRRRKLNGEKEKGRSFPLERGGFSKHADK